MLKQLLFFSFLLIIITSYSQQTKTPITGIDAIQLGDSISRVNTYGFPFIAVTKFRVSDSSSKFKRPQKKLSIEELKNIEYDVRFKTSDSGRTFCPDVSVFITNNFNLNQIQHSKTASLALTYFKNKLIEIRIIDSAERIRANYMYGLKKYGKGFTEQLDGYTLHEQARNRAVNPTDKMPPPRDLTKVPIATIAKDLREYYHIETIYWVNGNYSFAYNHCSEPYRFWIDKHFPNTQILCAYCGCEEEAITIRNDKAYKAMTACSDATLKQQMINKLTSY